MNADAIHSEICRALNLSNAHGSKTAAARALGYASPQAYEGVLREELSPSLIRRLLVKRCRVSIALDEDGSVDFEITPATYQPPDGFIAAETVHGWVECPTHYDFDAITTDDISCDPAIRRLTEDEIQDASA